MQSLEEEIEGAWWRAPRREPRSPALGQLQFYVRMNGESAQILVPPARARRRGRGLMKQVSIRPRGLASALIPHPSSAVPLARDATT